MTNPRKLLAVVACAALSPTASGAATLIFAEDFTNLSGTPFLANPSERGPGVYQNSISLPGWTIEGVAGQVLGFSRSGDQAVLLNEQGAIPSGISRTVSGLLPGVLHTLTFEYWGDNIATAYSFYFVVEGVTSSISASHSGLNTGNYHTVTYTFTPVGTTTLLRFAETSLTGASPLLDNISITAEIPEPGTLALAGLGLFGIAFSRRRDPWIRRALHGGQFRTQQET